MEANPEYRRAFENAQEDAADNLEAEVYRRAVKGVRKPVGWYMGKAGGYLREYSDVLLMFRLKALRPEPTHFEAAYDESTQTYRFTYSGFGR